MKKVLIITPQFPPSNLPTVHRGRFCAMHLHKFGWQAKIITVDPSYYEEPLDYDLAKMIPQNVEVIRTKAFPVRPVRVIGDISLRALWWLYRKSCELIKNWGADLLYIPIPPNYSSIIGLLAYYKFNIPYGIDYQDPWTYPFPGYERLFSKEWFSYYLGSMIEPAILRNASFFTAVSSGTWKAVINRWRTYKTRECLIIPFGSEKEDFQYLDKKPRPPYLFNKSINAINFVYAGGIPPSLQSAFTCLLEGFNLFKKNHPSLAEKTRFYFIGTGSDPKDRDSFVVKPLAEKYGLKDFFLEYPSRMPYLDVLAHLKHADATLIFGSSETHYMPSKVFQLILSKRPILAILHSHCAAVDILRRFNVGVVRDFDGRGQNMRYTNEMSEGIYEVITKPWPKKMICWEALEAYSAETMTKKLAREFDKTIESRKNHKTLKAI